MSKKIFSAQEWENVPSKVQQENLPLKSEGNSTIYNKVENDVECVVGEIERSAIDITSDYKDWVSLGFALAKEAEVITIASVASIPAIRREKPTGSIPIAFSRMAAVLPSAHSFIWRNKLAYLSMPTISPFFQIPKTVKR